MWQNLVIVIIVLFCALYVGRKLLRQAKGQSSCGCCNSGCPPASNDPGTTPGDPPASCGKR